MPIAAAVPESRVHMNAKPREIDLRLLPLQSCVTTTKLRITRQRDLVALDTSTSFSIATIH